jgi:hypothetical protein
MTTTADLQKLGFGIFRRIDYGDYIWWKPESDTDSKTSYKTVREAIIACIKDNNLNLPFPEEPASQQIT